MSLRHVRSYGTEGRRGGINEFPPSENVFDFIVFRGSDVKDLSVSDPVATPAIPDPAITSQVSLFFLPFFIPLCHYFRITFYFDKPSR